MLPPKINKGGSYNNASARIMSRAEFEVWKKKVRLGQWHSK